MAENVHLWEIVVDCDAPASLAAFYGELCACGVRRHDDDWYYLEPAMRGGGGGDSGGVRIAFQRVPEPKAGKVRLHLDLGSDDLDATVTRALALGATQLKPSLTDGSGTYTVLADPEGHEFCIVDA